MSKPNVETVEIESLKGALSLCTQLFENTCEQAGIDIETTMLAVSMGEKTAKVPISLLLAKFKEAAR